MKTAVTGLGLALPGVTGTSDLLHPGDTGQPVEPTIRIGKRGMRYKDRATQLALSASAEALADAGLVDADGVATVPGESVAVVVSANLGNLDSVCTTVDAIATTGSWTASPMNLPNVSSNVVASSVAIRFGLRGPNLMVCNGATSGLDAVHWATTLLAAGRAQHVIVVGVEPASAPGSRLVGGGRLLDGAVALVLESPESARERGVAIQAVLDGYRRDADVPAALAPLPGGSRPRLISDLVQLDVRSVWGQASGALGTLLCALAVAWFARGGSGPVHAVAGGDGADAAAALLLRQPEEQA